MSLEQRFFDLFESHQRYPLSLGYSSVSDWCIGIYDRKGKIGDWGKPIITVQDCDRDKAIAKAYDLFTDYLSENHGGY